MASLRKTRNDSWELRYSVENRPDTLYVGKSDRRTAEDIQRHVERLLEARLAGVPMAAETAAWLGRVGKSLRQKLERKGLVEPSPDAGRPRLTVAKFLEQYEARRAADAAPLTRRNLEQTRKKLLAFLGTEIHLEAVTRADMARFRDWLSQTEGLALNTVRTHCRKAKQFFKAAVDDGLLPENPCQMLRGLSEQRNEGRERLMSPEDSRRVWDACPTAEWRLIFALARFGGLRPSEILKVEWQDVRPAENVLRIRGSKGRHGSGPRHREVPLFREIAVAFEELRAERPGASGRVVLAYSDTSTMGVILGRIIDRAGVSDWQRPFQNLRSTRSTELIETGMAIHNYCRWMGHSIQVAERHYAQTRPEDAQRAAAIETLPRPGPSSPPGSAA